MMLPPPAAPVPVPFRDPAVVVCAWCGCHGRPQAAVRPPEDRRWQAVSHAFARAAKQANLASHGVCPACQVALAEAWGLVPAAPPTGAGTRSTHGHVCLSAPPGSAGAHP